MIMFLKGLKFNFIANLIWVYRFSKLIINDKLEVVEVYTTCRVIAGNYFEILHIIYTLQINLAVFAKINAAILQ